MKKIILLLVLTLANTGCATSMIWQADNEPDNVTTREKHLITGLYINKKDSILLINSIFLMKENTEDEGLTFKKEGFIFHTSKEDSAILSLSRTIPFEPQLYQFKIDENNHVTGRLKLTLDNPYVPERIRLKLKDLGFTAQASQNPPYKETTLVKNITMKGKVYEIEGNTSLKKLRRPISVIASRTRTRTNRDFVKTLPGKIIYTPLAIIVDGVTLPLQVFAVAVLYYGGT